MRISKVQLQTLISEELENVVKEEQLNEGKKLDAASLVAALASLVGLMGWNWHELMNSPEMQKELQTLVEPMDLDQSADTDMPPEEELELDIE